MQNKKTEKKFMESLTIYRWQLEREREAAFLLSYRITAAGGLTKAWKENTNYMTIQLYSEGVE